MALLGLLVAGQEAAAECGNNVEQRRNAALEYHRSRGVQALSELREQLALGGATERDRFYVLRAIAWTRTDEGFELLLEEARRARQGTAEAYNWALRALGESGRQEALDELTFAAAHGRELRVLRGALFGMTRLAVDEPRLTEIVREKLCGLLSRPEVWDTARSALRWLEHSRGEPAPDCP